jgi:hypothetical protein
MPSDALELLPFLTEDERAELDSLIATPPSEGYRVRGSELAPERWLRTYFPHVARAPLADFHREFWDWIDALTPGVPPPAFVGCWFRGAGKTTTAELGACYVGARLSRRFALFVEETQAQADERVKSVGELFDHLKVKNAKNDLGYSLAWRADQLRTENGFNVVGIGMDRAIRGIKLGKYRPDWIIIGDVDGREDTPRTTGKKLRTLTQSILKAGTPDLAVSFCQNLIHSDSIMSQVVAGTADFLLDRNPAHVVKAADGLKVEQEPTPDGRRVWAVKEGVPTWEGFGVKEIEADLNRSGFSAFMRESQQDVDEQDGGLWDRARDLRYWRDECAAYGFDPNADPNEPGGPELLRVAVAVDPSGSARGDEVGIVAAAKIRLPSGLLCGLVMKDASGHLSPKQWAKRGADLFFGLKADRLLAESNFGGEMVEATFETAEERDPDTQQVTRRAPDVTLVRVSRGKQIRAQPVQKLYEDGRIFHLTRFVDAERELCTWHPESGMDSPGRLDAIVIVLSELFGLAEYVHVEKGPTPVSPLAAMGGAKRPAAGQALAATPETARRLVRRNL